MMQRNALEADVEAVLSRYDTVAREVMIQLARWASERAEWQAEREELQEALERAHERDARLQAAPLQEALQRAISRVDGILAAAEEVES